MSTIIKPEDVRPRDVVNVVYERDGDGVQSSDNFAVVRVVDSDTGPSLYFGRGTYDYIDTTASNVDHIELVDWPKPVIKVGDRVRYTTQYGTVTEFDVHTISEHNYAYPRDPLLPGRQVEHLELVTEQ